METELVHTEAGAAVDDPEAVPPVLYEVGEIIDFARKFADLICVDFQHDQVTYWELMSKKFRYCPSDDPDDGLYPVRCIVDGNGHVKLRILNFVAREANWFTERTDAEVIIRSLSYYGHRHRFCPGILIHELQGLEGHLSSEAAGRFLVYANHPYEHYRSRECSYFYSTHKSSISRVVAFSRCVKCRKVYTNKMQFKKSLLNLTQEQIEDKIMKQIHPSSRVKITTLPPELARIRIESQSQRQRKHRIRTIQKKHEPQPIEFAAVYLPEPEISN